MDFDGLLNVQICSKHYGPCVFLYMSYTLMNDFLTKCFRVSAEIGARCTLIPDLVVRNPAWDKFPGITQLPKHAGNSRERELNVGLVPI